MNLIAHPNVTLTKPEENLLAKLATDYGLSLDLSAGTTTRTNPYYGKATTVSLLVANLYDFVMETFSSSEGFGPMTYHGKKVAISIYDRTRYLVMKLDSKAYSALLD